MIKSSRYNDLQFKFRNACLTISMLTTIGWKKVVDELLVAVVIVNSAK
ncbi:MAG: hypothetical protein QFX40_04575 [Archaeoglobales archaeon]|nr:hypothetical protein [Archaeoglobales archaeon]